MWLSKLKSIFSRKSPASAAVAGASTGRIKFFNRRRGYGFIEADGLKEDVFVHVTDLEDFVSKGDPVSFELQPSERGLEAKRVKRIKDE